MLLATWWFGHGWCCRSACAADLVLKQVAASKIVLRQSAGPQQVASRCGVGCHEPDHDEAHYELNVPTSLFEWRVGS
jgi:hypothetical protein